MINYYIDPSPGFIFFQNTSFLWGLILGLLGAIFIFFKLFFKFLKKFLWFFFIFVAISIIGGKLLMHKDKAVSKKKVIILGIDAMDPNITEQLIREDRLPNLTSLKTMGSYSHLTTTIPAESVVAWTSFATGLNPGNHRIFDFIMRNPEDYSLYLSLNEISSIAHNPKIQIHRKGETFWNILSKNNFPCFIYFCPNTFPPDVLLGRVVSGMGVPDISGTMGRFSFYTTEILSDEDKDSRGKIISVESKNKIIDTEIYGPKIATGSLITESTVPLRIILIPDKKKISLEFQGNQFFLNEGNWSEWKKIFFKINPFRKIRGILRFYLKSVKPGFELYASPINIDPQRPFFPISYPYNYSKKLAKKIGFYYTQGMPHDTWVLSEERIDEKVFLEIADEILREKKEILHNGLKEFKSGVFFFYFENLDIIQHMFWRYIDSRHPLYDSNSKYKDIVYKYYEKIDSIIGEVLKIIDKDTTLIVLSDHGFTSFRKSVHLNRWLLENGFLSLKPGINETKEFFEDVAWEKTQAYALGFGGIYINRIGREYSGIVSDSEIQELKRRIATELKQVKDDKTGEPVVKNVYLQEEVFKGPYVDEAPDLFVGFHAGYRASWQTALGGIPNLVIEDNERKWSGDHLVSSELVPGVIFINKKVELKDPSIIDIAPTILDLFRIDKSKVMRGRVLFNDEAK